MNGFGGDDDIQGREGDDVLDGGSGFDQLLGGAGVDYMTGGAGNDLMFGDATYVPQVRSSTWSFEYTSEYFVQWSLSGFTGGAVSADDQGDRIEGGVGEDEVDVGDGNDVLPGDDMNAPGAEDRWNEKFKIAA